MDYTLTEFRIKDAIVLLTGLEPYEKTSNDRYSLNLGQNNPLEIGYDKKKNNLSRDTMRRSALIKMLETITRMMQDDVSFCLWLNEA